MEKLNAELLEYIEEALKIGRQIEAKNKTHNLDVIHLQGAKAIVEERAKFLKRQAEAKAAEKQSAVPAPKVPEPPKEPKTNEAPEIPKTEGAAEVPKTDATPEAPKADTNVPPQP